MESPKNLFNKMDKENAGLVSYHDFYVIMREDPKQLGWLFKARTVIDEDI